VVAAAADELSPASSLDGLEEPASAGPVLVTVDNVQWADLATTQALRSMPRLLASYPLFWILTIGTSSDTGPAELLFGPLEATERPGSASGRWILEARRGPRAALDFLAGVVAGLPEHRSVLLTDPASAPWLVRVALAAGDREQAARIVTAIGEVARDNPTLAFIRASAEHAEGLLTSDVSLLQHASAQLRDPWARACAVEDQGVLLTKAGRDREAIRSLEEALREYDRLGARPGVTRTRRRLRQLGVRRPHWASEQRPAAGWGQPHPHRAGHGPPGGRRPDQPPDSRPDVHRHAHARVPSAPGVPQARHQVASTWP
jgi:hypothetical protein